MKDKTKIKLVILLFTSSFLPVISLILYCFGYTFSLFNYTFFAVVSALIFLALTLIISKSAEVEQGKILRIMTALLPLLSLINSVIYIYKNSTFSVAVCMTICFICSAVTAEKICKSKNTKVFSVISSGLLSVPLLIISVLLISAGSFGANSVVETIYSPDKTYYAEIIDSDQGALGGDTVVYVHKTDKLNLLIMTVSKTPQRVYLGEWKEYESMQIQWESEQSLVINSKEYHIEI